VTQESLIEEGRRELRAGDWLAARDRFRAAIELGESAEALDGLAMAAYWLNDLDEAIHLKQRAHVAYKREHKPGPAAFTAAWIGGMYMNIHGNQAAAEGWRAVCTSLIAEAGPCRELARLLLLQAALGSDLEATRHACEQAVPMAKQFGDRDCEILAGAYLGLAMVCQGELPEGMARLDEAMALSTSGEVEELWIVGFIYCAMLAACERVADFARADQWCSVGGFVDRYRDSVFSASCRACYGSVLTARGQWEAAERELTSALRAFEGGSRNRRIEALSRLASLRVSQGRAAEAVELLEGLEEYPEAALPRAALELADGRAPEAAAILDSRLASLGPTNVEAGPVLNLLVEAEIAAGEIARARANAGRFAELTVATGNHYLSGLAALSSGLVTAAERGDPLPELESAVEHLMKAEVPLEAARARIAIANAHKAAGDPVLAAVEARMALATFERLGAVPDADAASALLRRVSRGGRTGPKRRAALSRREDQVLSLLGLGLSNEELASRLFISPRTAEHHVSSILSKLDLKSRAEAAAYAVRHQIAGEFR
jgi:DNA-binding CsgD family transcriptional regulator